MATTKITSPDLFNLESLNTALQLPSGPTDRDWETVNPSVSNENPEKD